MGRKKRNKLECLRIDARSGVRLDEAAIRNKLNLPERVGGSSGTALSSSFRANETTFDGLPID